MPGFLRFMLVTVLVSAPLEAGEILLNKSDLVQIQPELWAAPRLDLPEPDAGSSLVGPANSQDGTRLLRILDAQGDINGFAGILYDNRDRGHSVLDPALYPTLTHLRYGSELVAEGLDFGLGGRVLLPTVVLGNSSTALNSGPAPRSLPRLAMTSAAWRTITPVLYENNYIYVYPEHHDYDQEDLFPINWPYMIVSQGSSGSDLAFLKAAAATLAALPRETFEFLRTEGLVAPTLQMILRQNLATVSSREDYLSGSAHPPAFDGRLIRMGLMVAQASKLRPEDIPPLVRLRVVEEDFSEAAGLARLNERLLDTPAAIGRIWRGFAWNRELVVSTEETSVPNDRPLTFEWRLLRGDPRRVWIEPLEPAGSSARIGIDWHDPWTETLPTSKGVAERRVSRVDIGVFASNGVHDSAPSMISIDFPAHQVRKYGTGPDGEIRLVSIDYNASGRGVYFDPLLFWTAPWTDTARHNEGGELLGWDRLNSNDVSLGFAPHGSGNQTPDYEIDRGDPRLPTLRHVGK